MGEPENGGVEAVFVGAERALERRHLAPQRSREGRKLDVHDLHALLGELAANTLELRDAALSLLGQGSRRDPHWFNIMTDEP